MHAIPFMSAVYLVEKTSILNWWLLTKTKGFTEIFYRW